MRQRLPIILSTTALVIAVFGSTPLGEAAMNQVVPRNSVGTAQLRANAVTGSKIRSGAVTSSDVRNRSLRAVDFAAGQIPAGPQGPQGPQGPAGPTGAAGPVGVSGYQTVFTTGPNDSTSYKTLNASCPSGKRALSGGVAVTPATAATAVGVTRTYLNGTGTWETAARETSTFAGSWMLNAVVICATVAG
jgi:hypothetical protein